MNGLTLLGQDAFFAFSFWPESWPSFDPKAALIVAGIVAAATVVVITVAILAPPIAIAAGASWYGTTAAVTGIALLTGAVGGAAAGIYWGGQGDIKRQEQIERIIRISNQLDIYFQPSSSDPNRAADFACTLVRYEETDITSQQPTVTTKKTNVTANDSGEFYGQIENQMKNWFSKPVGADATGTPRRIVIYMKPYPGEGIYERLKEMAGQSGRSAVIKIESKWVSALD